MHSALAPASLSSLILSCAIAAAGPQESEEAIKAALNGAAPAVSPNGTAPTAEQPAAPQMARSSSSAMPSLPARPAARSSAMPSLPVRPQRAPAAAAPEGAPSLSHRMRAFCGTYTCH
jgi:hypothetical protein